MARWLGLVLVLIGIVSTVWLAITGQLTLYIHPRYELFTVILAALGAIFTIGALFVVGGAKDPEDHEHDEQHDDLRRLERDDGSWGKNRTFRKKRTFPHMRSFWLGTSSILIAAAAFVILLVLPPATLSVQVASERDVADSSLRISESSSVSLVGADSTTFTVKDWAILLGTRDSGSILNKQANVTGFAVGSDDPNIYFLSRFLISCCAVDAQPVGVPVYDPGWSARFPAGTWLDVSGSFTSGADVTAAPAFVLRPSAVEIIEEPRNPYVF